MPSDLIRSAVIASVGQSCGAAAAAWVQAGAATLALAVAIGVAAWQSHQNRELLREQGNADLRRRLEALLGLLQAANSEVWRCRRFLIRRGTGLVKAPSDLEALRLPFDDDLARIDSVMGQIVLHELPSWDLARAVLLARTAVSEARSAGALIFQAIEGGQPAPNPLAPQVEMTANAINDARSACERLTESPWPPVVTEFSQDPMQNA